MLKLSGSTTQSVISSVCFLTASGSVEQ